MRRISCFIRRAAGTAGAAGTADAAGVAGVAAGFVLSLTALLTAAVMASCAGSTSLGYDDEDGGAQVHPSDVSIAWLRSLAVDESVVIDRTVSVSGRVTATDAYGEFYKTIYVEDDTGGIEVLIDRTGLHAVFALYDRVRIECHGLALGRYGSRIELGMPPTGEYVVDRIAESDIGRYITADKRPDDSFAPVLTTIAGLRPEHVGRTVKIESLHAAAAGMCWCDTDPLTGGYADSERRTADVRGDTLTVYLRGSCVYAGEKMPDGEFALCGIVEYRSGSYALRITNRGILVQRQEEI